MRGNLIRRQLEISAPSYWQIIAISKGLFCIMMSWYLTVLTLVMGRFYALGGSGRRERIDSGRKCWRKYDVSESNIQPSGLIPTVAAGGL